MRGENGMTLHVETASRDFCLIYTKNASQKDRTELYINILPLSLVTVKKFNSIIAIGRDNVVVANNA